MLSDKRFENEIRPEWVQTIKDTNAFEAADSFKVNWKAYFSSKPKGRNVVTAVSKASGHSVASLKGDKQEKGCCRWRQLGMYVCFEYLDLSKSQTARVFNRDHSAATYSIDQFRELLAAPIWRAKLDKVLRELG